MKNLKLIGAVLSILLCSMYASAQERMVYREADPGKEQLFAQLPSTIDIASKKLNDVLQKTEGNDVSIELSNGQPAFSGKIVSVTSKYENRLKTVVIRLNNGATFTLSSSTNPDGTASYVGRIISFQYGDTYELRKKDDQYIFIKKSFSEMVTP